MARQVDLPDPLPVSSLDPIGQVRALLEARYPDSFGGFVAGLKLERMTVLEVGGPGADLEANARDELTKAVSSVGLPVASATAIDFSGVQYPLARLDDVRRQISETGLAPESGVWGVGLDEANNRVVIFEDGSAAAEQKVSALRSEYGRDILRTEAGSMPRATVGRYSDVAPWNAGDQIVDSGTLSGCTTGFGVHRDGYWCLLSAGHCGAGFWY